MLAEWIDENPELLDVLREREFTDLELPEGVGLDPEAEDIARRGLARLYWTRELGPSEMMEQLDDIHTQDAGEAIDAAREWSNGKVFQICMHGIRNSLTADETGLALSRVAEASIAKVLAAVEEDLEDRGVPSGSGGVIVAVSGPLARENATPGTKLDVVFVRHGTAGRFHESPIRRCQRAIRALSRRNLLLAQLPKRGGVGEVLSMAAFEERLGSTGSDNGSAALKEARCVFASGDPGLRRRFESLLRGGSGPCAANGVHADASGGEHDPTGGR